MMRQQIQGQDKTGNIVNYLLKQNRSMKEQLQDVREMIKMNKIEIDVLSKGGSTNKYIDIICNYRRVTENNQKKIEELQKQMEEINSEKLILEQLNQQANQELKAREELHRDRIEGMQQVIAQLERKMVQIDKNQKSYDGITGFVERNKEIFNPTEQAVVFKNREDQFKEEMHLLELEKAQGKENEDNLLKINGILRHKVVTLQAKLAMPNKNLGEILDKSLKRLMMYFIETQKRLLTGEESDSEGEEDLELIAPELSTYFGEEAVRRQSDCNVPHLDLLKIRGSVATGNAKIKEQLIKRNHLTKQEKIERLQIELQYTRRELTKNIITLREQIDRRRMLQRICQELQSRNELLAESNQKFIGTINKYTKKIKESKEKHSKFVELDDTANDVTYIKVDNYLGDPKRKVKQTHNNGQGLGVFDVPGLFDTPEEYKIHLQLLSKDLAKNRKIQNLDHLIKKKQHEGQEEWQPRLKRSTSNPFLYFNQRRDEIMDCHQQQENPQTRMRFEQTAIFAANQLGMGLHSGQNLDDIEI